MWLIGASMRRPITIVVGIISLMLAAVMALSSMKQDIFPDLNIPSIYVVQGYGGMAPDQMEGYLVSTYEIHFLYIPGVDHIESKSIQNILSLIHIFLAYLWCHCVPDASPLRLPQSTNSVLAFRRWNWVATSSLRRLDCKTYP